MPGRARRVLSGIKKFIFTRGRLNRTETKERQSPKGDEGTEEPDNILKFREKSPSRTAKFSGSGRVKQEKVA